ncbi:hypothetical protein [Massilia eburnea]|uniref:hypothetical protein n=1 Tax=Massilia eburnea TaxID=1776165 RepID=UPI003D6B687F
MKIITRLKWAQWLCVAGVALAVLLMIGATRQVKQELQRNERAGEIVSGVVALRYLSLEYAQTQERRSHVQWQLRKDSLQGMLLRDDLFREEQEAQLLHDLQENLPLLARHFFRTAAGQAGTARYAGTLRGAAPAGSAPVRPADVAHPRT